MKIRVRPEGIYKPSDDVVARNIEGEIIIVPLVSGIGDSDEELFTLNETGKAVWEKLDGRRTLRDVIRELETEYKANDKEIGADVLGLVDELLKRKMLMEAKRT